MGNGSESRSVMPNSFPPHGLHSPWSSPGRNTGVGSLSLLQGIFPTQGSNPGLPHGGRILYQLSYHGRLYETCQQLAITLLKKKKKALHPKTVNRLHNHLSLKAVNILIIKSMHSFGHKLA